MSRNEHTSDHGSIDLSDDRARAVDEAGRRAGAALRSPAPVHGAAAIQGRAHRRRVVRVAAATAVVGVVLVTGLMAFTTDGGPDELRTVDEPADTTRATPDSTAASSTIETSTNPPAPTGPLEVIEAGTLSGYPWLRYSADGSLLALESADSTVLIHDAATLTQLRELPCPTRLEHLPESVGTAPDWDRVWDVAAAARWDADDLKLFTWVKPEGLCGGVTVSADGSRAVTDADVQSGAPQSLLWDTSDGSVVAVIPGLFAGFSTDGSRLVMSNGPSFSVVDSTTGAVVRTVTDNADRMVSSPDGSRLLRWGTTTGPETGVDATIYDTETLTPLATLSAGSLDEVVGTEDPAWLEDPVFDDTSGRVANLYAGGVTIWDASTGAELQHVAIELTDGRSVALSPGGAMIAVRNGGHITIIDSSSGVQLADLDLSPDLPQEVEFSADGASLAAGVDAGVRVWFYDRTD